MLGCRWRAVSKHGLRCIAAGVFRRVPAIHLCIQSCDCGGESQVSVSETVCYRALCCWALCGPVGSVPRYWRTGECTLFLTPSSLLPQSIHLARPPAFSRLQRPLLLTPSARSLPRSAESWTLTRRAQEGGGSRSVSVTRARSRTSQRVCAVLVLTDCPC